MYCRFAHEYSVSLSIIFGQLSANHRDRVLSTLTPHDPASRRAVRETRETHQSVVLKNENEDLSQQQGDPVTPEARLQTAAQ